MAYMFKSGTIKRTDVYDFILNSLLATGWQNISSNIADGDVLVSNGINGDKNLVFQMFPYPAGSVGVSAANYNNASYSIRSSQTNYAEIEFRLCMKYTPGTNGSAGTILRPSQSFIAWTVGNTSNWQISPDTILEYNIYVDKSKLILALKAPDIISRSASFFYIGLPDTQHVVNGADARGLLIAASPQYYNANGLLACSDYPHAPMGSYGNIYACSLTYPQPTKIPNANGIYLLSEPYYYSDLTGEVGKLDGVYMIGESVKLSHGDIIPVGNAKFKVLNIAAVANNNSFGKTFVAIQIA
ncbi:MAG: hypothetical protein E6713_07725 [Sporomusaceae bacterium]|nr:hypothetical protein [Sporomusaceae bacterium]